MVSIINQDVYIDSLKIHMNVAMLAVLRIYNGTISFYVLPELSLFFWNPMHINFNTHRCHQYQDHLV